jgi:CRISPR-associated protein Cas1
MELCMENQVGVSFLTAFGHLQARLNGSTTGNVLLRREQYRIADDHASALNYAKLFILGKTYNQIKIIDRCIRDHKDVVDGEALSTARGKLFDCKSKIRSAESPDELLGIEGDCGRTYFGIFDMLILKQKEDFKFNGRSRRPPLDYVNAMLSFSYGLVRVAMQNALECVGLDPYVGFYHVDRPGRQGLALDMMEEFRGYIAERFVLNIINLRQINAGDFLIKENEAVLFTEEGKKKFLDLWNKRWQETITHPFLEETIPIGLLPHAQSMLMARTIRGDLEAYPVFFMDA